MTDNYLLNRSFTNRGYTKDFLINMDVVENSRLAHLDDLLLELKSIYDNGDMIVQITDFDMDGISAGCLGFAGFAEMGFRIGLYALNPSDGYGFTPSTITSILNTYPNAKAIITSDVGISCHSGVAMAHRYGLKVFITDHHKVPNILPDADVIINPMQDDDDYEHPFICGAYVLYQCLYAYAEKYCNKHIQEQIRRLRVFAGLGTVSDGMPLLYGNRQLVRDAVSICRMIYCNGSDYVVRNMPGSTAYRSLFFGLFTVIARLHDIGKIKDCDDIDEDLFSFYLAPMFNSVKRMSGDINKAFGVFFGFNQLINVDYLYSLNEQRKSLTSEQMEIMLNSEQPFAPYIWFTDTSLGILGLMAQKIMNMTGLPCVVLHKDSTTGVYHGSGRSLDWYPFLSNTSEFFNQINLIVNFQDDTSFVAGHESAFGISLANDSVLKSLYDLLVNDITSVRVSLPSSSVEVKPDFIIDHNGTGDTVIDIIGFIEYLNELEKFKPFGPGFYRPNIALRFRPEDAFEWIVMGSSNQHLKLELPHGFEVLLWNQADKLKYRNLIGHDLVVLGHIGVSEFNDLTTVNFTGQLLDPVTM